MNYPGRKLGRRGLERRLKHAYRYIRNLYSRTLVLSGHDLEVVANSRRDIEMALGNLRGKS